MSRVLILRPEPGARETAARAAAIGLDPLVAPLFTVRALDWTPPETAEAVLMTSANAARHGGAGLARLLNLPCYTVGEATAAAARAAGFADVRTGPGDGAAAAGMMAADGVRRALHLCGRDHVAPEAGIEIDRRIAYEAVAVEALPEAARTALRSGAVALLHSPRAAALFARLVPDKAGLRVAAISPAAAAAAGDGWAVVASAEAPRDQPLLELAAKLCNSGSQGETGPGE